MNNPNDDFINMRVFDFELVVHLGKNIEIIERTRYNFWDILGDVGGFNGALLLFQGFIMNFWSSTLFRSNLAEEVPVRRVRKKASS